MPGLKTCTFCRAIRARFSLRISSSLLPENIEEIRDRGFAYARLDYLRPALEDLERYLDDRHDAEDATTVETQLNEIRQRTDHGSD